jgi:SAM-dependent methyltransferase
MQHQSRPVRWAPEFFDRPNIESAKSAILSDEAGLTIEQRWVRETEWLMSQFDFPLPEHHDGEPRRVIVDYGCGIGRLSKPLVQRLHPSVDVLGVDASPRMVEMAPEYVSSKNFSAVTVDQFRKMVSEGYRANGMFSVWVLQHIQALDHAITLLRESLEPGSVFWVGDQAWRCYPAADAQGNHFWAQMDEVRVTDRLLGPFWLTSLQRFPDTLCEGVATLSRWVRP